jgi:hypothetical protein
MLFTVEKKIYACRNLATMGRLNLAEYLELYVNIAELLVSK